MIDTKTVKKIVNLHQFPRHHITKEFPDKFVYFVDTVTNTLRPAPGDSLSEADAQALIDDGVTVNIKKGK